ncbi:hypothetical protein Q4Q39_19085 [Flavivirga amylovorans]|uniref:Peptidase M48 domain-containing protein n=1 Tax=Flavivirga amylovorans TaxID=870486 RepID=A0ABT8X7K4_9FLAO|nr:hypothetical protein [Flavivirga amylovorans]MDO5989514.1 hypothetical protein [Flavivirga amylovorans]
MNDSRQKVIRYLEKIQKDCLKSRFGSDYINQFENLSLQSQKNNIFEKYAASQPSIPQSEIEGLKKRLELLNQSVVLNTNYEFSLTYTILKSLYEKIEFTANKLSLLTPTKPFIGTALSKEYNAFAGKVPDTNEYLIVFEGELFILCNLLSKIVALSIPDFKMSDEGASFSLKKARIVNHIKTNPDLQEKFADLVHNAIFLGQPNQTKQYFLNEPFGKLQYELFNSLELFVVGHEYGHIYCGHLSESNIKKRAINHKDIDIVSPDWDMEYEADFIGLKLLLNSLEEDSLLPFSYLGPELFFTFLDLNDRINNLQNGGIEKRSYDCETHPPPFERRDRIRRILKSSLPSDLLESYIFISEFLENVMDTLWDDYKDRFIKESK